MNLSMKWLSDYVELDVTPRQYADAMSMSGSKVEGYEIEGEEITKVVAGKILSVEPHPDADKLVVCQVEVGAEAPIQIVTGAKNVFPGAVVPVALDGSTLPGGVKIKKGKLRGQVSNGMMCSLSELNLTVHDFPNGIEDGIYLIEDPCQPGDDIHDVLGLNDVAVEFEITSNRPDCLSIIGLARETAATFSKPLKLHTPQVKGTGGDIAEYLSVEVQNPKLCMRYSAKAVKNVKIGPSPRWMRERLRACGVRPINNIVDITNYVMLEYGQPMHAFDLKYVEGGKITVRNAREGEHITTLDDVDRALSPEMLVIADAKKPVAVAGVMGGEFSGIMEDTQTVIFESACFGGASVRRTARKLGLRTESSGRYEKGLDPNNTYGALLRACELVELLGAGEVVDGLIDVNNASAERRQIPLEPAWINRFLGISLTGEEMAHILRRLDFQVEDGVVTVPTFRSDIEHKADVAEEVARLYGYNNIPTTQFSGTVQAILTSEQKYQRLIHRSLLALGLSEICTYSFISPSYYDRIALPAGSPLRDSLRIKNPLGEDTSVMRTTGVPSMLETLARNYNNRNQQAWLYEIAKSYHKQGEEELPLEAEKIVIGLYGSCDFYTLKGVVETLFRQLNLAEYDVEPCQDNPTYHPGRCAVLSFPEGVFGTLAEVHPQVLKTYGIDCKAYIAELDITAMMAHTLPERQYTPLPKFPATTRDLALVCDEELPILHIEKVIQSAVKQNLEKITLFDIYRGQQVGEGKKSVAYSITMRSPDKTLTDEEADAAVSRILKGLAPLGVTLRS